MQISNFSFKLSLYSLTIIFLALAVAVRISWQRPAQVIPKNQEIKLLATVKKEPKISGSNQVIEIGDGRVFADLFPRFEVGDRLEIEGKADSQGNIFKPKIDRLSPRLGDGKKSPVLSINIFIASVRSRISKNINQLLPNREATLVQGAVLGVDDIEKSFKDQLIATGTIHVVVVSGQNLMIVAGVFMGMAKNLGRRKALFLATATVFGYAILTGFEPPVVRASLMVLVSTIAIYFGREMIPIWGLFIAALVILFFWPQAISEISFQLTFAATLGIMTLGQMLEKRWLPGQAKEKLSNLSHLRNLSLENAAVATSAYIFTAPIILYYFGRISILSPMANIFAVEAVSPVMIIGFLVAIFSLIFMPLAQILAYFVYVPAFYFVKVVEIFAGFGAGQMSFGKGNWVMVVIWYGVVLGLIVLIREKNRG